MKVRFCWSDLSGYMAACWKQLHRNPRFELRVLAYSNSQQTSFAPGIMGEVDWVPLAENERSNLVVVHNEVAKFVPDIIVIAGWLNAAYMKLSRMKEFGQKRYIMAMDTPWQGTLRQYLAPHVLRSYLNRMDAVIVTGERAWLYGKNLGIPENRLFKGQYGVDHDSLSTLFEERISTAWPKQFVFAGRYSEEKGIADLIKAYQLYRQRVPDPWQLVCCGKGELEELLVKQEGVVNRGFVQPAELYEVFAQSGALVMPSHFDPWPLALVEGCAAGLPIIATHACGSAVECVRQGFNGFMCPSSSPALLANALTKMHFSYELLPEFGSRSLALASAYSTEQWMRRWCDVFEQTMRS